MTGTSKVAIGSRTIFVGKYHNEGLAASAAARQSRPLVLGDINDPWGPFWVAHTNRDAFRLVAAGYEVAR